MRTQWITNFIAGIAALACGAAFAGSNAESYSGERQFARPSMGEFGNRPSVLRGPLEGGIAGDDKPPPGCPGDSLLAQQPSGPGGFVAYVSEVGATYKRFENFSGVAGAIEGIRWFGLDMSFTGSAFAECTEFDPTFIIEFYEDNGGVPGALVCSYTLLATRTPTGISYLGAELNQYDVTLPSPCIVVNGWLSIVGDGDPSCWFLWLSSPDGNNHHLCENCQSNDQEDDLSFCFLGTPGGVFGACCNQSTGTCQSNVEINQCVTPGLKFVPNTTCANLDPPCAIVTGACCFSDGACAEVPYAECQKMEGSWLGANTTCSQCPPVGACCAGFEGCSMQTEANCSSRPGYVWLGPDSECGECPEVPQCDKGSLFGQNPESPFGFIAGTSEENSNLHRFEDFSGVAGPITALKWWGLDLHPLGGSLWSECEEFNPTFNISFHKDAGGVPGDLVCSYTLLATRTPLGLSYLGTELNEYSVELPSPCIITHGWISIVGVGDPACWFLWMSSGVGDSYCDNCLPPPQGFDLSVCFIGETGGVFGACCNDVTGICNQNVEITDCLGAQQRFAPNASCASLDPPCGTILGACCFANATCSILTQNDCGAAGGSWLGPNTICSSCPCITPCVEGGVAEGEPMCSDGYVDEFNGGCFMEKPLFSPIAPNQTVCGTAGVFLVAGDFVGDFDWYEVHVSTISLLTWAAKAEFRPQIYILNGNNGCPPSVLASAAALECDELSISDIVLPGTYWLLIGPLGATDSAACGARYVATLSTLSFCPADIAPPPKGSGEVDVDDLLLVINSWGECEQSTACIADLAPEGGNGVVDVDDLLTVINGWGLCPLP